MAVYLARGPMLKILTTDSVTESRLSAVFVVYGDKKSAVSGTNAVSSSVAGISLPDTFRKTH